MHLHADILIHLAFHLVFILIAPCRYNPLLWCCIHISFRGIVQDSANVLLLQSAHRALDGRAGRSTAEVCEEGVANNDVEGQAVAEYSSAAASIRAQRLNARFCNENPV